MTSFSFNAPAISFADVVLQRADFNLMPTGVVVLVGLALAVSLVVASLRRKERDE